MQYFNTYRRLNNVTWIKRYNTTGKTIKEQFIKTVYSNRKVKIEQSYDIMKD